MRGHKRVVDPRDVQLACRMLLSSVDLRDAFIQRVLWRLQYAHIQGLASGKVEVPHCYYLMGVADPSNTLAPNEIVVLLHDGPVSGPCLVYRQVSGPCLVYRPPSLLVSNIRRLSAVHSPAVLSLLPRSSRFCVIFSTRGQRSVTDCMGGGDLDGDRFLVIMHPQIVSAFRERPLPPACPSVSEPLPPLPCDPAVRERALIRCWLDGELYNRERSSAAGWTGSSTTESAHPLLAGRGALQPVRKTGGDAMNGGWDVCSRWGEPRRAFFVNAPPPTPMRPCCAGESAHPLLAGRGALQPVRKTGGDAMNGGWDVCSRWGEPRRAFFVNAPPPTPIRPCCAGESAHPLLAGRGALQPVRKTGGDAMNGGWDVCSRWGEPRRAFFVNAPPPTPMRPCCAGESAHPLLAGRGALQPVPHGHGRLPASSAHRPALPHMIFSSPFPHMIFSSPFPHMIFSSPFPHMIFSSPFPHMIFSSPFPHMIFSSPFPHMIFSSPFPHMIFSSPFPHMIFSSPFPHMIFSSPFPHMIFSSPFPHMIFSSPFPHMIFSSPFPHMIFSSPFPHMIFSSPFPHMIFSSPFPHMIFSSPFPHMIFSSPFPHMIFSSPFPHMIFSSPFPHMIFSSPFPHMDHSLFHMGTAGNLHVAHMDRSPLGPDSPECLQLAALYELALDSAKTGHVVEGLGRYKVESYPHFMRSSTRTCYHSTSLMGQMFDAVQEERRKHVVDSGAMTPDAGIALLASKDPNGAASRAKWEGLLGQYEVQVGDVVRQRTTLLGGARRARLAAIENKFRQELEQGWTSSFEQPFRPQHMLYEAASLYMVGYETARRELALQAERRAEALAGCGAGGEAGGDVEMRSSGMTGDGDVAGEDEWGGAGGDEEEEGVGDNEGDDDEVMEYDEGEDMEDEDLADCTNRATLACRFVWHVGEEALCEAKSRLCLRTGNGVGGGWGVENGGFEGALMTMEKQAFADIMGLAILRAAAPSSLAPCQASKEGKWGVQLPWEKKNDEEEEEEEVQGKSILGVKLPWKREAVVEEEEEEPQSKTILGQLGTMRWSLNPKDDKQQQEEEVEEKGKNSFFDQIGTMRLTLQGGAAEVEEEEVVEEEEEEDESSSFWRQWYVSITGFPFPLRPFLSRKTYRYEVDRNSIWCFEQEQGLGFSNVTTNVRMTVIKLKSGGLFVHAPIAPTAECLKLLKDLNLPVEHIVLPTFAYEHKVFAGPFARAFPKARTWVAPRQWSWPINLPLPFLGLFGGTVLAEDGPKPDEWPEEIDYKIFASPEVGIGPYVEIAFFHRPSRTLLLTDAVIVVPREPPQVVRPDALLDAARNGLAVRVLSAGRDVPDVEVEDTEEFRTLGWQRMVLQILFFGPGNLLEPEESFERICGKLVVSPVVKTLVFDKVPAQALAWINSITSDWAFTRIIPCHFSSPIAATPADLRKTFAFLQDLLPPGSSPFPVIPSLPAMAFPSFGSLFGRGKEAEKRVEVVTEYAEDDLATLSSLDSTLVSLGVVKRTGDP
ncbi:unnamed protein product [Closterium sp. NIES-65]|nr:unnamed protein product [Closterium sp. NIES-65]